VNPPFLIIETGQPIASMRRHRGFPHWIRVAAGLGADDVVAVDVERGQALPGREGFAGAIVTGSNAMVTDRHPWSEDSAAWLRDAAHAGLPLLGICYGHQLLAHALGGEVGYNPAGREMGTVALDLLAPHAEADPLFAGLPARFTVQATHLQSVLRMPDGGTVLASSAGDACHAFRWGKHAWGVQFHPEFSTAHMRGYLDARRDALASEGRDAHAIADGIAATPNARRVLRRFVRHARALVGRRTLAASGNGESHE
jgi:GMP synthase (glutamine-hydrolysing)